ncbi:hypothetical protein WJX72_003469 [[Myrmecia] bisecta]|uniref:Plastid lipid-associated protein/fibrillin conserved domain-containing protein n=1 Tax=[Myrmecia] bisecta TaxID=41462 RepID=A0AAW1R6T7_9CHLO
MRHVIGPAVLQTPCGTTRAHCTPHQRAAGAIAVPGRSPSMQPMRVLFACLLACMVLCSSAGVLGSLPTPWTADVDPQAPLPEYPRPQMTRSNWVNLNGIWEWEAASSADQPPPFGQTLKERILVPFPVEAPLSQVAKPDVERFWYRRTLHIPAACAGQRILLHFGAVDWESRIYVNQKLLTTHRGGYDKFWVDITDALLPTNSDADNELVIGVWDPTDSGPHIALGKQRRVSQGIWYTASSGIWQTVWLEPVPKAHITQVDLVPDIDNSRLHVLVHGSREADGLPVSLTALDLDNPVSFANGKVGTQFDLPLEAQHLWSPSDPFLYGLVVELKDAPAMDHSTPAVQQSRRLLASEGGVPLTVATPAPLDQVRCYFGMRKISLGKLDGEEHLRIMLNNEFVFQMGMLDQGFWPDGIYTPPTDEALRYDLLRAKSMGFNMLRKHIKVESDRWYYHADSLGVLVWQDWPAGAWQKEDLPPPAEQAQFEREMDTMIRQHISFPSIITFVVFNEGWGQYDTERITKHVQTLDASRLFDCASGWVDYPVGDLIDYHVYVGPAAPHPPKGRAAVLGEFGGLGLKVQGHMFAPDATFAYEMEDSPRHLQDRYLGLVDNLKQLILDPQFSLSAAVYTELSDVEDEVNGFVTYDRSVLKDSGAADALVDEVLNRIAGTDSGEKLKDAEQQEVNNLLDRLEQIGRGQTPRPLENPIIFGNYNVAYVSTRKTTQDGPPAGGSFRTGLGRLLFPTKKLCQSILQPDTVTNKVEFALLNILPGWVGLRGRFEERGDGKDTVQVFFEPPRVALAGGIELIIGPASSVVLTTTYLDERVRLGRGSRGSLFVFTRGGQSDQAGMDQIGLGKMTWWGYLVMGLVLAGLGAGATTLWSIGHPIARVAAVVVGLFSLALVAILWRGGQSFTDPPPPTTTNGQQ